MTVEDNDEGARGSLNERISPPVMVLSGQIFFLVVITVGISYIRGNGITFLKQ